MSDDYEDRMRTAIARADSEWGEETGDGDAVPNYIAALTSNALACRDDQMARLQATAINLGEQVAERERERNAVRADLAQAEALRHAENIEHSDLVIEYEDLRAELTRVRSELARLRDATIMLPPDWVVQIEHLDLDNHPIPDQAVIDMLISWEPKETDSV